MVEQNLIGHTLGNYEIVEEIGKGGMGVVYKAVQPSLQRFVAIKVLRPPLTFDDQFVQRFQREALAAGHLRNPHIVTVLDVGQEHGLHYIVMEFLQGRTLGALIRQEWGAGHALTLPRVATIVDQIASALDDAHQHGLVHRDVKPANIFVDDRDRVTLTDFGIAKAAAETERLTQTGVSIGTPEYMSPEQARGEEVDHRSDVYALGIVVYQMLTGRVPFQATTPLAVLYKQIHEPLPALSSVRPGLPLSLDRVLDQALAKEPEERYGSAGALAEAFNGATRRAVANVDAQDTAPDVVAVFDEIDPGLEEPDRRRVWPWVLAAVVTAVLGVVLLALWIGPGNTRRTPTPLALASPPAAATEEQSVVTAQPSPTVTLAPTSTPPSPTDTAEATTAPVETPTPTETPSGPALGDTWTRRTDGMVMVFAPAGEFMMGHTDADIEAMVAECGQDCKPDHFVDELPAHRVEMDGFWIDQTEVTNAQYAAFLDDRGNLDEGGATWLDSQARGRLIVEEGGAFRPIEDFADHPVALVTWYGAAAYCKWVGGRLPTEAEWEYAARGPRGFLFPWGNAFDCHACNLDDEAKRNAYVVPGGVGCDGYDRTAPVGSFPAGKSWCGALDMIGNVWEWVADWYDADYYSVSPLRNPRGPDSGPARELSDGRTGPVKAQRGGSWYTKSYMSHTARRGWHLPFESAGSVGFRCAADLE
jgi:serine/threonine-protein kinase